MAKSFNTAAFIDACDLVVAQRNVYNDNTRRTNVFNAYRGTYYSDCSSMASGCLKAGGVNLGGYPNTEGLLVSNKLRTLTDVEISRGLIQNPEILNVGDILLFRGDRPNRQEYVGHVEVVYKITNGSVILQGHGGQHPRRIEMQTYCRTRYRSHLPEPMENRGLICVRRPFFEGASDDADDRDEHGTRVRILGETVNARLSDSTAGTMIKIVRRGERYPLVCVSPESGWYAIRIDSTMILWVSAKMAVIE